MMLGQQQKPGWRRGEFGPGGGSLPYNIMATGAIAPFSALDPRQDVQSQFVQDVTRIPVGMPAGFTPTGTTPAPGSTNGVLLGQAADGRPVRQFDVSGNPNTIQAQAVAAGARQVAQNMRSMGLANLPTALVGGPLSALARGEAIVLRWPNGIQVGASL